MVFPGKLLNEISSSDILHLIQEKVAENTTLEYKREPWESNASGRDELLKDVSAMANSQGGYIIIGINTIKDSDGRDIPQGSLFSVNNPDKAS